MSDQPVSLKNRRFQASKFFCKYRWKTWCPTVIGCSPYENSISKRSSIFIYLLWLAVATARVETVAAAFTVLQELPSAAESRVSLAGPAQLSPSRAPSPGCAPPALDRAPSRVGGSSAATEPYPPSPEEARRGSHRLCAGAYLRVIKVPFQARGGEVVTQAGVTSPQARSGSLEAPGSHSFLCSKRRPRHCKSMTA